MLNDVIPYWLSAGVYLIFLITYECLICHYVLNMTRGKLQLSDLTVYIP